MLLHEGPVVVQLNLCCFESRWVGGWESICRFRYFSTKYFSRRGDLSLLLALSLYVCVPRWWDRGMASLFCYSCDCCRTEACPTSRRDRPCAASVSVMMSFGGFLHHLWHVFLMRRVVRTQSVSNLHERQKHECERVICRQSQAGTSR